MSEKRGKSYLPRLNKKSQVMNMPFMVIFSIFLIVVFIVVAFIAIKHFLNIKNCTQLNTFVEDMQGKITDIWKSQRADTVFTSNLPSSIEYVCFVNFSLSQKGEFESIFIELEKYSDYTSNFVFYPQKNSCNAPYRKIVHVNLEMLNQKNPYCFPNENGISINMEKSFDDALVRVS